MDMGTGTGHDVRNVDGPAETLRCRRCGEPVRLDGSPLVPEQMRKAVHVASGSETGGDGHLAAPIGQDMGSPS
jgi:hypothetical protein